MKMNKFSLGRFVFLTTIILYSIQADEIIEDMFTLDKMFRDLHPVLDNVTWSLVEQLTADIHEKLCHEILTQITPPEEDINKHKYVTPEAATIRKSRVIRQAPLYFQRIGVQYVPVIVCTYEDMKVYLTHGDDKHVFRLNRDKDNIFTFRSGLHPIPV